MLEPNVISFSAAAREKGVHRSTLYRAADRGELSVVKVGRVQMLAKDEAYLIWQPQDSGGRVHDAYQQKQQQKT